MKTTTTVTSPIAYLAVGRDKNRLKIYGDNTVYLKNGQEFMFELFNPTQKTVGAKIFINGESISNRLLVLRPAERDWLMRYIENDNKFVFGTYNVENTQEVKNAIANNGVVRVEFYDEYVPSPTFTYYPFNTVSYGTGSIGGVGTGGNQLYRSVSTNSLNVNGSTGNLSYCSLDCNISESSVTSDSIETGRVEAGSASGQSFDTYNGTFNSWATSTVEYKILPESQQPVETNQLRQYCPGCRTRIRKQSWKFCPSCGEEL